MTICKTLGGIHGDSQGFVGIRGAARLWERICRDLQGFVRFWERIHNNLQDFGRGFVGIHEDL